MKYPFVQEFVNPSGSPIRELHKHVGLPGMISFAAGYPDSELFDVDGLGKAAQQAYANPHACLQYTATEGLPQLRLGLRELMKRRSVSVADEELLITTGSQQGFDLLLRVMVAPGDCVLTEEPTYPATLQSLKLHQADVVGIPADANGIDTAALRTWLERHQQTSPARMLYTVPSFGNPSGGTLSLERRLELLALAVEYGFVIVEDDPYSELRFTGDPVASLLSLANAIPGARQCVVHLASLSKIIAGGLRVGWMIAPDEITRRCVVAKQTIDLCSSPWMQSIAAIYLASGSLEMHMPKIIESYRGKCQRLESHLTSSFGSSVHFESPQGGMFLWASLEGVDSTTLLRHAIDCGVLFVPGSAFYAEPMARNSFRLSYATPSVDQIEEGVKRLKEAYFRAKEH